MPVHGQGDPFQFAGVEVFRNAHAEEAAHVHKVAGSEATFAELMNNHAYRLGMSNTHFVNSTGLPHEDHYTTPYDIAKAAIATIRDYPEYYHWYRDKSFVFNGIKQHNRNKLLWRDESVDGIKTGHTEDASANNVLQAEDQRDDGRFNVPTNGAPSPLYDAAPFSQQMLRFEEFGTEKLKFKKKKPKDIPSLKKEEFLELKKAKELVKFLKEF